MSTPKYQKARLFNDPLHPFWVEVGAPQRFALRAIREDGKGYEDPPRVTNWYVTNIRNPVDDSHFPYARIAQEDVELLGDFANDVEDDLRLRA